MYVNLPLLQRRLHTARNTFSSSSEMFLVFLHASPHLQPLEHPRDIRTQVHRRLIQLLPLKHPHAYCKHGADTSPWFISFGLRLNSFLVKLPILFWTRQRWSRLFRFFPYHALEVRTPYMKMQASLVGGRESRFFFTLRNAAALSSLISTPSVPWLYSWQTNALASAKTLSSGGQCSPRCSMSFDKLSKIFKADCLPISTNWLAAEALWTHQMTTCSVSLWTLRLPPAHAQDVSLNIVTFQPTENGQSDWPCFLQRQ